MFTDTTKNLLHGQSLPYKVLTSQRFQCCATVCRRSPRRITFSTIRVEGGTVLLLIMLRPTSRDAVPTPPAAAASIINGSEDNSAAAMVAPTLANITGTVKNLNHLIGVFMMYTSTRPSRAIRMPPVIQIRRCSQTPQAQGIAPRVCLSFHPFPRSDDKSQ
jgi:hypothetical protein